MRVETIKALLSAIKKLVVQICWMHFHLSVIISELNIEMECNWIKSGYFVVNITANCLELA